MWSLFKADVIDLIPYFDLEILNIRLKGDVSGISAAPQPWLCQSTCFQADFKRPAVVCVCVFWMQIKRGFFYRMLCILVETLMILIIT